MKILVPVNRSGKGYLTLALKVIRHQFRGLISAIASGEARITFPGIWSPPKSKWPAEKPAPAPIPFPIDLQATAIQNQMQRPLKFHLSASLGKGCVIRNRQGSNYSAILT